MKRIVALTLLVLLGASNIEAAIAPARDGAVHHETATEATSHAALTQGEHGHEDAGPPSAATEEGTAQDEHGPDHQHGTGADHCTHAHGTALTSAATTVLLPMVHRLIAEPELAVPTLLAATPLHQPPRS